MNSGMMVMFGMVMTLCLCLGHCRNLANSNDENEVNEMISNYVWYLDDETNLLT